MTQDFGQGIFEMDFITKVSKMKDLATAKRECFAVIDLSTALDENIDKAFRLVKSAKNVNQLVIDMANFSLSHQGLKVIK